MMRRNDSGTTEGRKKERKIEKERERKGIALCNQLSLRLFFGASFFFATSFLALLCCFIDPSPRAGKVEGKSCL